MVTLSLIGIGASISLLVMQLIRAVQQVPSENREWRDRPPWVLRCVWPIIQVLDFYCTRFYSKQRHNAVKQRLVEAGLEYTFTSGQFIAARWMGVLGVWLLGSSLLLAYDSAEFVILLILSPWGYRYPDIWLGRVVRARNTKIDKDLPFYLDVITLAVESGSNLTGALTQAVKKAPDSPLRFEFNRVLRDIRAGKPRAESLRELSARVKNDSLKTVIAGMIQAERSGASLGVVLRAQSTQFRAARFAAAEKKAMEAPVKLLAPLVLFIFPTTFIVLGFLVLSKMLQERIVTWAPLVWAYTWPS
jgi:tight adherence protein C